MQEVEELRVLKRVFQLVTQEHPDVQTFLHKVLATVNDLIGSHIAFISTVEGDRELWLALRQRADSFVGSEAARRWSSYVERLRVGGEDLPAEERSFTGYVAYTKKSRRVGDVRGDPFYLTSYDRIRSELAVPILLDGEVLGVLNLESEDENKYTPAHEELLDMVATAISRPLDSLLTREGRRRSRIEVVDRIKHALSAVPPDIAIEDTRELDHVAALVAEALQSKSCTIWLSNAAETTLILTGAYDPLGLCPEREEPRGDTPKWRVTEQRTILRFGQPYGSDQVTGEHNLPDESRHSPSIIAPLLVAGKSIGALSVALKTSASPGSTLYKEYTEYTPQDERLLNIVQSQIAASIEDNRRRKEVRERLGPVSDFLRITAQLDLRTVLDEAIHTIPQLCGGLYCSIFLWDGERSAFVLAASNGLPKKMIGEAYYDRYEGLTGWVGATGKSLVLANRATGDLRQIDPRLEWTGKYDEVGSSAPSAVRPFLAVPITPRFGGSEGVIRISDRSSGLFTPVDEQVVTLIATYLSAVLAYCRKYEHRVKRLQIVQAMMVRIQQHLRTRDTGRDAFECDIIEEAAAQAYRLLNVDILLFYRYDGERRQFATAPICAGGIERQECLWATPAAAPLLAKERAQFWADPWQDPELAAALEDSTSGTSRFIAHEHIASMAAVPLTVGSTFLGVALLAFKQHQPFVPGQQDDIRAFADQIALALKIADLSRTTVLREAEYLRQEIHDSVAQTLGADVILRAGSALDHLRLGNYEEAEEHLKVIERASGSCQRELYTVFGLLTENVVEQRGLKAAIESYIHDNKRDTFTIESRICEVIGVPLHVQRQMYRVAQSGFMNAVRHSRCRRMLVSLDLNPGRLVLHIEDDGVGFNPGEQFYQTGHYGLSGTSRRLEGLGGELRITSCVGKGTTFEAEVPINGVNT